jgi:bifunctional DNA-binding transcriptional regulator/antitoxin component of YhaV-PrlF toxin-antitoxin module
MLQYRTQLKKGGRILIPATMRKALQLKTGENIILRLKDESLHVMTLKHAILKAQSLVQKHNKSGKDLTEELFKIRGRRPETHSDD